MAGDWQLNWEIVGATGEDLGAFAVVISFVYLAAQIRSQNKESRIAAMHEISGAFRDCIGTFSNLEKADIYIRGNQGFDSLSDAEKFVLISGLQRVLCVWEEVFHQHRADRLDEHIWDVMVKQYASLMSAQPIASVWGLRQEYFDPDFRAFVNTLVKTEYKTS